MDNLRDEAQFKIGQRIQSWDFEPRAEIGDRYVIGTITKIEDGLLFVKVEIDTAFPENPRPEIHTPINVFITEWEGRLVVLDSGNRPEGA